MRWRLGSSGSSSSVSEKWKRIDVRLRKAGIVGAGIGGGSSSFGGGSSSVGIGGREGRRGSDSSERQRQRIIGGSRRGSNASEKLEASERRPRSEGAERRSAEGRNRTCGGRIPEVSLIREDDDEEERERTPLRGAEAGGGGAGGGGQRGETIKDTEGGSRSKPHVRRTDSGSNSSSNSDFRQRTWSGGSGCSANGRRRRLSDAAERQRKSTSNSPSFTLVIN